MRRAISWLSFSAAMTWFGFLIFLLGQVVVSSIRRVEVVLVYPGTEEVFGMAMLIGVLLLPTLLTRTKPWDLSRLSE